MSRKTLVVDNVVYEGYPLSEVPNRFGCIDQQYNKGEGIPSWFKGVGTNEGLVFIANPRVKPMFKHTKLAKL